LDKLRATAEAHAAKAEALAEAEAYGEGWPGLLCMPSSYHHLKNE
jgi:hypothetical protein